VKGLALLAAAGTSVLFGFGSVLQKAAAERVVAVRRLDARLLPRLLRQGHYLLGWICDTAGWVLQVAALTVLPLFVVQGFVVMGTGCTALLAWWLLGTRLSRRGWRALGLMLGAGVALALTAPADRPVRFGFAGLAVGAAVLGTLLAAGRVLARHTGRWTGTGFGALAGVGFALVAVFGKAVAPLPGRPLADQLGGLLRTPAPYLVVAAGAAAALLYATGLQRGQVVAVEAPLVAVELILPAALGITVLGESLPGGWRLPLAIAGRLTALAGSLLLAREPATAGPVTASGR
jgi:hypothetical protein